MCWLSAHAMALFLTRKCGECFNRHKPLAEVKYKTFKLFGLWWGIWIISKKAIFHSGEKRVISPQLGSTQKYFSLERHAGDIKNQLLLLDTKEVTLSRVNFESIESITFIHFFFHNGHV